MRRIIVIRHGKSSWDEPVQDHERKLLSRGIQNAIKIGQETKSYINPKSLIWSSFAKRALSTAMLVVENWNLPVSSIEIKNELYTFNGSDLEQIVKSCSNNCESLILFGHNNAITDFVNKFGDIFIDNVPTSGFVSIIFETNDWKDISNGKTDKIVFPRDL